MLLRFEIEVNQQIAAKHEVIRGLVGHQCRVEQVTHMERDLLTHPRAQLIAVLLKGEIALTKLDALPTKRVFAIHRALGALHRERADIQRIDLELMRGKACVKHRHRNRIRLFAG